MKVSVILPVYGVAQYIEKCTESLLAQTLDDIEFLYVDDHGPDNSIELAQKKIAGHPRAEQFRFLTPPHNMGAGMARNYAIPEAKGEYIAFVDSDDWVEPTMFEELYKEAKRYDGVDLCYCQISKDYLDGQAGSVLSNPIVESGTFTPDKRRFFLSHYVSLFSTFIFKRELVERYAIRFPEERSADDSYFVSCCLMMAQSVAHVDKPFYHYIIRPGSVCTTKDSNKYQKRLAVFGHLLDFARGNGVYQDYKHEVDYIYLKKGAMSSIFNYVYNSTEPQPGPVHSIMAELKRQIPDYEDNPYYRSRTALRLLVWLSRKHAKTALKVIAYYVKKTNPVV